jgi:hypothetical protein
MRVVAPSIGAGFKLGHTSQAQMVSGGHRGVRRSHDDVAVDNLDDVAVVSAPPAKRNRSNGKRGNRFQARYTQTFGLRIVERDAKRGAVVSVSCRFCIHVGREGRQGTPTAAGGSGNPRSKDTIKYFSPLWRTDRFIQNLKLAHKNMWIRYQHLTGAEKESFLRNNLVLECLTLTL